MEIQPLLVMGTDFSHAFGFAGASTFPCCPKAVMVPAATVSVQGQCSEPTVKQNRVVGRKEPMEDLGKLVHSWPHSDLSDNGKEQQISVPIHTGRQHSDTVPCHFKFPCVKPPFYMPSAQRQGTASSSKTWFK